MKFYYIERYHNGNLYKIYTYRSKEKYEQVWKQRVKDTLYFNNKIGLKEEIVGFDPDGKELNRFK